MLNRYNDSTTSYVLGRLANATPEQIDSFIIESCELDNVNYLRNAVSILGSLKFKTIIESNVDILKLCVEQKAYKAFETIFVETDLDTQIITNLFLNEAPPLEISLLLNNLNLRNSLFVAIDRSQIDKIKRIIQSEDFSNYPHLYSLLDKSLMRMFTGFSQDINVLEYFLFEEKLKDYKDILLKQSLNLAVFTQKYEILKYLIIDLHMEKTKYVDILLELDRDKYATKLFNSRDLSALLHEKLEEKTSEKRGGSTKI